MAPILEGLQQQYGSREFVVIAVAGAWQGADAASTAEFIRTYKATWAHVFDRSNSVFNTYKVDSTPAYFIIDTQGIIRYRYDGEQVYATLAQAIDRLLPSQ
jgi:cytochrome oxidase Cu insertion factor (SCO1/SenC/PrrC family)